LKLFAVIKARITFGIDPIAPKELVHNPWYPNIIHRWAIPVGIAIRARGKHGHKNLKGVFMIEIHKSMYGMLAGTT
jgi:hypothetical protein